MMVMTLSLVVSLAFAGLQSPAEGPAADRLELTRLERVWNDAHVRGDSDTLERLWADGLVVTVPGMPVMHKADTLGIWRSGRMRFDRYATSEVHVDVYGDAAVVTGRLRRSRTTNGRVTDDDWRFTKVYVRRGGRWVVVAWHASETAA